jgi:hypothetical protein
VEEESWSRPRRAESASRDCWSRLGRTAFFCKCLQPASSPPLSGPQHVALNSLCVRPWCGPASDCPCCRRSFNQLIARSPDRMASSLPRTAIPFLLLP